MKTKQMLIKSLLIALAFTLFIAGIPMNNVSAKEDNLTEQEAVEILEALDNSSIKKEDGTILFNRDQLKRELKGNPIYLEIKRELKKNDLLTSQLADKNTPTVQNMAPMMAAASSSQINPKWKAVRDSCAKKYLGKKYGFGAATALLVILMDRDFAAGVKFLISKSMSVTVAGLMVAYAEMNYKCIKLANSKHKVYK